MSESLTFIEFSTINQRRAARWHGGAMNTWSISDWAMAVTGEWGEACNALKKLRRIEDHLPNLSEPDRSLTDTMSVQAKVGEELADTFIYLDLVARACGISLEAEIIKKFNATSERYGFPERL